MSNEHLTKTLQNAKLFVEWTETQQREKIVSKENISTSLGKIAKLFTDLENVGTAFTGNAVSAYQIAHNSGLYKVKTNLYRYVLLLTNSEDTLLPINTEDNNTDINKTLTTDSFNPFGKIFYHNSTSTIYANESVESSTLYEQIVFDLRYSFNCGQTLVPNKDIFIVATVLNNGMAKLHVAPISQTMPTTEDNLIYIYLGHTCSSSSVELSDSHPIFCYKNNKLQLYTGATDTTYTRATTTADGLLRQLDNNTENFLRGDGVWASPESIINSDIDEICI